MVIVKKFSQITASVSLIAMPLLTAFGQPTVAQIEAIEPALEVVCEMQTQGIFSQDKAQIRVVLTEKILAKSYEINIYQDYAKEDPAFDLRVRYDTSRKVVTLSMIAQKTTILGRRQERVNSTWNYSFDSGSDTRPILEAKDPLDGNSGHCEFGMISSAIL